MLSFNRRFIIGLLAPAALLAAGFHPAAAQEPMDSLEILAPSSAGSGYDQLARTIQSVLQSEKLVSSVEVQNVAGGGGTVGLAQFVTGRARSPKALVVGFALVGGVITTQSAVTLDQVEPVARLIGEYDVIVVPAKSDIQTLADLVAKLKADPGGVSWGGGSVGGIDHVLVGLIAKTVGVDPTKINYVVHAGGGEVLASVLGGHTTVGVSGYEEFRSQIEAGELRALAVSADARAPGGTVPTLKEAGVDMALLNWRGLTVHPDMAAEDKTALAEAIGKMVTTQAWKDAIAAKGWLDLYLPAAEFKPFLADQQAQVGATLKEIGLVK